MVVDLPAPFGPRKPNISPSDTVEVDAAHGVHVAEVLDQRLDLDGRLVDRVMCPIVVLLGVVRHGVQPPNGVRDSLP